jgi:flagellar biogenesis protein FliO
MLKTIFFTAMQAETSAVNNVVELPSAGALFFRILFSLLFIILVVYFILKIINKQQNLRDNQKKWLKILDYQALGPNRGLYLMELYDLTCIVAVSEGQIHILKEIATNTLKWKEIKDNLQQAEDLIPAGLSKIIKNRLALRKKTNSLSRENFQQQLAEQFRRSQYLSRDFEQGRDRDE